MTDLKVKKPTIKNQICVSPEPEYIHAKNTVKVLSYTYNTTTTNLAILLITYNLILMLIGSHLRDHSKHKKPFISAPERARAILSVFLNHLA